MMGLITWTVFCLGAGALTATGYSGGERWINGVAASFCLWALGVGLWMLVVAVARIAG